LFSQTIFLIWSFNLWSMEWIKSTRLQKSQSIYNYPDNVSILNYDRRSHHPATRIMFLYWIMTGEVIIQLPG
jgi:hypothetical protein